MSSPAKTLEAIQAGVQDLQDRPEMAVLRGSHQADGDVALAATADGALHVHVDQLPTVVLAAGQLPAALTAGGALKVALVEGGSTGGAAGGAVDQGAAGAAAWLVTDNALRALVQQLRDQDRAGRERRLLDGIAPTSADGTVGQVFELEPWETALLVDGLSSGATNGAYNFTVEVELSADGTRWVKAAGYTVVDGSRAGSGSMALSTFSGPWVVPVLGMRYVRGRYRFSGSSFNNTCTALGRTLRVPPALMPRHVRLEGAPSVSVTNNLRSEVMARSNVSSTPLGAGATFTQGGLTLGPGTAGGHMTGAMYTRGIASVTTDQAGTLQVQQMDARNVYVTTHELAIPAGLGSTQVRLLEFPILFGNVRLVYVNGGVAQTFLNLALATYAS